MTYIYMAGGAVLEVSASSEAVLSDLRSHADLLTYEVNFPAGGAKHPSPVAVNPAQISVVSDQRLPDLPRRDGTRPN
jgi:hypothetical protein